jgi:hypothetical protein
LINGALIKTRLSGISNVARIRFFLLWLTKKKKSSVNNLLGLRLLEQSQVSRHQSLSAYLHDSFTSAQLFGVDGIVTASVVPKKAM